MLTHKGACALINRVHPIGFGPTLFRMNPWQRTALLAGTGTGGGDDVSGSTLVHNPSGNKPVRPADSAGGDDTRVSH